MPAFNWGDFFTENKDWIVPVIGGVATLVGNNQQNVANNAAQDANLAAIDKINNSAWTNYLMTRGISPNKPVAAGVLPPKGQYTAVNTRLPLYATMPPRAAAGTQRWVKRAA